ncbi:MAG: M48 family metalloprotease [Acidobacteria bacterium]|nr:M48 family metalloprotease [Acidobacteriota bacterium]
MKYKNFISLLLSILLIANLSFAQKPQEPQEPQTTQNQTTKEKSTSVDKLGQVKQEIKIELDHSFDKSTESKPSEVLALKLNWQAPRPRAKNKGPFGPIPWEGINIFKGEASKWLADSIERIQIDDSYRLKNPLIENYIDQLGDFLGAYTIVPNTNLEFIITQNEAPNATSIGGGKIIISKGLLQAVETEDELAGVLAHEIAHDTYAHLQKTLSRQLFWLAKIRKINSPEEVDVALDKLLFAYEKNKVVGFFEKLSGIARFDELKADQQAFYTTYRAGYNPRAISAVLKRIEENNKTIGTVKKLKRFILGTHPLTSYRAFALDWEAGFVKLPPKNAKYESQAFDLMKKELARLDKELDKELDKKDLTESKIESNSNEKEQ